MDWQHPSRTPFTKAVGIAAPLLRDNVDTDAIIPSREIRSVTRDGVAEGLFAGWRYISIGGREPDPDFVLNDPVYSRAVFLPSGSNFGSGSSREFAAWALAASGIRAIIASSFNPLFEGNCVLNGIVPVVLPTPSLRRLAAWVAHAPAHNLPSVALTSQQVIGADVVSFAIAGQAREILLHGLDPIAPTLRRVNEITVFRAEDAAALPWAYLETENEVCG